MKKIQIYILLFLLSGFVLPLTAQNAYKGEIKFSQIETRRQQKQLTINFQIDLSNIDLSTQRIIRLIPVLKGKDGNTHYFDPVFVSGRIREKVISRNGYQLEDETVSYVIRKNGKEQFLPVTLEVGFEDWMYDADLDIHETITGCAECDLGENLYPVAESIVPPRFIPQYELQYVTPPAEEIKRRSESYAAHLNFKVGKYDLLRDFQNNATILNEVDRVVRDISKDDNLTIQEMTVTGFASPEGNYNSNLILSKNRTTSFVKYLIDAHNINNSIIKTDWKGEDWEGLKKNVANSSLADRDMVVRIIDNNANISQRKQQLQTLNGGTTYRVLLNDYYPALRRIEYTFSYIARAFDIEEAKEVMKTKPQHLSLNEMFLVAQTYEKGTKEFDQIFDIAVRLFPDNDVANLNAAVQEINMGATDKAIERLKKIEQTEAYNNLGIAYVKKEQYQLARQSFKKAIEAGNEVAQGNLEQLERFLQDQ